ncbi:hypothetical protein [Eleftheria terrae]|uniref:hypothetical protein n=1 Tax=Eleftheria terrae TaxID=1597781 RepID=UPI00263BDBB0|nr:hypothetical protein [Eleftheria terrae]WKB53702.1 hypothetical protein N7L95_04730 [Eleftheria terrae]
MKPIATLALLLLPALTLTGCGGGGGGGGSSATTSTTSTDSQPTADAPEQVIAPADSTQDSTPASTSGSTLMMTATAQSEPVLPAALTPRSGLAEVTLQSDPPLVPAPVVVTRSTFDDSFTTRAPGWTVNAFDGATWSASKSYDAAVGTGAQSFVLLGKGSGDAHLVRAFPMKQGRAYEVRVKWKLPVGKTATLQLRHDQQPWETLTQQVVQGTGNWEQLSLKAAFPHADQSGGFRVAHHYLDTPILLDDFELIESRPNLMAQAQGQAVSPLFSGMHVNKLGQHNSWPPLGVQIVRLHDTGTTWRALQPEDAPVDFSGNAAARRLDYYVFNQRRFGGELMYTFSATPTWAASDPTLIGAAGADGAVSPLKDVDAFRRFVRQMGQRYKGHIRYWEMWNEANYGGFWRGTAQQQAEMTAVAAEELKAIDPENKIVSANITWPGLHWMDAYLSAGAAKHIDVLAYHYYGGENAEAAALYHYNVRQLAARHGLSHLPIFNTEGDSTCDITSLACPGIDRPLEHARLNARAMLTMAAAGVGNYNYYYMEGRNADKALLSSTDWTTVTPAGLGYAAVSGWLAGATVQDGWCGDGWCVLRLQGRGWAVWPVRDSVNVTLPFTPVAARLLDGQRIGVSGTSRFLLEGPVFFEQSGAPAF